MSRVLDFFIRLYNYQPLKYKALLISILFLLIVAIVMLIIIIRTRTYRDLTERRYKRIKATLESIVLDILFQEDPDKRNEQISDLKKLIDNPKSTVTRDAVRDMLNSMSLQLEGDSLAILTQIYRDTGVKELLIKELNEKEWHVQAAAIEEIGNVQLKELLFEVLKYTDHENEFVRNKAQVVVLKLGGLRGLQFLDTLKNQLSEWQQIQLLNQLLKMPYNNFSQTEKWLKSSNDSVVMFGLKVTHNFMQFQHKNELVRLLDHSNSEVVGKTLKTISHLGLKDLLEDIKMHYPNYSTELKVEVLKTIGELGSESDQLFLIDCLMSDDYYIVKAASDALINIGQRNLLYQIKDSFPDYQREIIEHSLDERI